MHTKNIPTLPANLIKITTYAVKLPRTRVVVKGYTCRFVEYGDVVEPDDYNCKAGITKTLVEDMERIVEVVKTIGW